jgi:hypothetical protein
MITRRESYGAAKFTIVIICDHCKNEFDSGTHYWKSAWSSAEEKGWRALSKKEEWRFACDTECYDWIYTL